MLVEVIRLAAHTIPADVMRLGHSGGHRMKTHASHSKNTPSALIRCLAFIVISLSVFSALALASEGSGPHIVHRDITYTPPPGVTADQATLDVTRPRDAVSRPLVLLVHGGSWAGGDKAGFAKRIAPWWADQGYVAAAVNFRLATKRGEHPVVSPTDQVRDLAAALAWLNQHAETYGIDRKKTVILGYSSGAHLVALLGTDERYLHAVGLGDDAIDAVISLDVHAYDVPYALTLMRGSVVERNMPVIRHLFGQTAAEQQSASPIHYVDGWAAPALIISADADPNKPGTHGYIVSHSAVRYTAALRAAGHHAESLHDASETHRSLVGGFGATGDKVTAAIAAFIAELR